MKIIFKEKRESDRIRWKRDNLESRQQACNDGHVPGCRISGYSKDARSCCTPKVLSCSYRPHSNVSNHFHGVPVRSREYCVPARIMDRLGFGMKNTEREPFPLYYYN